MEDSNWLLIRLPNEIQYYVARYIDLTCLGALLLTSKQTNTLFQHDLAFQSIVRTATTMAVHHSKFRRPVRVVYNDHLAFTAAKYNDASILESSMEYDISANSIISKLRPKKGFDLLCAPQKSDLMTQILAHDADKVLEFLIEAYQKDLNPAKASAAIPKLFIILMEACFSANDPTKSPNVLAVLLKFFGEHRKFLFRVLLEHIVLEPSANRLLQAILKYIVSVKYPFDVNEPIEVKCSTLHGQQFEFDASPLEAAAFYGLKNVFHLLLDRGAFLDLKRPYLPLLYLRNKTNSAFFDYLQKLGADLNALLPENIAPSSTILGFASTHLEFEEWDIECLLLRGAKLSAEEATTFLEMDPTSSEYFIAIAQMDEYTIANRKTEISLSAPSWNSIREFKSSKGSIDLEIKLHGGFEYKATRRLGQWKQRPDLALELTSRQQKKFVHYGSYGTGDIVVDAPEVKYEFIVYRNHKNNVALVPIEGGVMAIHKLLMAKSI
jgi:hypothetical protein